MWKDVKRPVQGSPKASSVASLPAPTPFHTVGWKTVSVRKTHSSDL